MSPALMSDCRSIMFSAGSACASVIGRPSHACSRPWSAEPQHKVLYPAGFRALYDSRDIESAAGHDKCRRKGAGPVSITYLPSHESARQPAQSRPNPGDNLLPRRAKRRALPARKALARGRMACSTCSMMIVAANGSNRLPPASEEEERHATDFRRPGAAHGPSRAFVPDRTAKLRTIDGLTVSVPSESNDLRRM